jgi:hypothetical protein
MGPIQTAGEQSINQNYKNSGDIISRMMASRGYGSSGNMGNTMYQTDLSRLSDLSSFKGTMANLISTRQQNAASQDETLIGENSGKNVSTPGAGLANGLLAGGNAVNNLNNQWMTILTAMGGGGN